jgi:hypothetical protein
MSDGEGSHEGEAFSHTAAPLPGRMARAALAVAVLGGVAWGASYAWRAWGVPATRGPEYLISAEKIIAPTPPAWIRTDVVQEVVHSGSLENQSILDPQLTIKVADAFRLHPWVRSVRRVSKSRPAKVEVDLEYRRPAALVEITTAEARGVLPIDDEGVLLPRGDFVDEAGQLVPEALKYPVIVGGDALPEGAPGAAWGNTTIVGAARVAAALAEVWEECGLFKIAPAPHTGGSSTEREYLLLARNGSQVIWGPPPGDKPKDQSLTRAKLEKLLDYVQRNRPFDPSAQTVEIDLRNADEVRVVPYTARLP